MNVDEGGTRGYTAEDYYLDFLDFLSDYGLTEEQFNAMTIEERDAFF